MSEFLPADDAVPALVRPYLSKPDREGRAVARVSPVRPVSVRLIGARADVAALLRLLDDTTTLTEVTDPRPSNSSKFPGFLVYATVTRRYPLTGGTK